MVTKAFMGMSRAGPQTLQSLPHPTWEQALTHLRYVMSLITLLLEERAHHKRRKSVTCSKTEISISCVNTTYLSNGVHNDAGKCKLSSWSRLGTSMQ